MRQLPTGSVFRSRLLLALCASTLATGAFAFGESVLDLRGTLDVETNPMITGAGLPVKTVSIEEAWSGRKAADIARELNGTWKGQDLTLEIDSRRAQARVRADRPFQWERFIVQDATDSDVAFSIGAELFEAAIEEEEMSLGGTTFRGKQQLRRQ